MSDITKELLKRTGLNKNELPKIKKITLNICAGAGQKEKLNFAYDLLWKITGQKPIITKAKKSVAGFSIREGWPLGVMVTLRRKNLEDFQDKLLKLVLPAVRDFEGLKHTSFDGRGNYSFGIKDHSVFPEIPFDSASHRLGIDVSISTSAKTNEVAKDLLELVGYPLKKTAKKSKGEDSAKSE